MTSPDKSSRWTPRRIIKWLFLSVLALFLASIVFLAAGSFIFNYWLKTADINPAAQWVVAKFTGGEANFQSVTADLTKGVSAKAFRLRLPSGVVVRAEEFDIGFDLRTLIKGSLEIDHINVDRPRITFADTAKSGDRPADRTVSIPMPIAPVFISLGSLTVKDISFEFAGAGFKTELAGLSLIGAGAIGPKGAEGAVTVQSSQNSSLSFSSDDISLDSIYDIDISLSSDESGAIKLKGSAGLQVVKIKAPYKIDPGRADAKLDADFNIAQGTISGRSNIEASVYGKPALKLETGWKVSKGYLEYDGRITRLNIDLKHLPGIAGRVGHLVTGFASFSPARVKGKVALGEDGESTHSISGAGVIRVSKLKSEAVSAPQGVTIMAQLNELTFTKGAVSGKALANVISPVIESSGAIFDNLTASIEANPVGLSSGKIYISVSADNFGAKGFQIDKPALNATFLGDFVKGDLSFVKAEMFMLDQTRIATFGSVLAYGKKGLDLTAEIRAPLKDIKPWLEKLTQVKVHGGQAQATIKAKSLAGIDYSSPEVDLSAKVKIRNFRGGLNDSRSKIGPADFSLNLSAKALGAKSAGDATVEFSADLKQLDIPGVFASGPVRIEAGFSSSRLPEGVITGTLDIAADRLAPYVENKKTAKPVGILVSLAGRADMAEGKYELQTADLKLGPAASIVAKGFYEKPERLFGLDLQVTGLDLHAWSQMAPDEIKEKAPVESVSGLFEGSVKGGGVLPSSLAETLSSSKVEAQITARLRNGSGIIRQSGVRVDGADLDIDVEINKQSAAIKGGVWIRKIGWKSVLGEETVDSSLEFSFGFNGEDRLLLDRLVLESESLGLLNSLEGTISGAHIPSLIGGAEGMRSLLMDADVMLDNYFSISLDNNQRLLSGITVSGDVDTYFSISSRAGEDLSVTGESEFINFSVNRRGNQMIKELNGKFPFTKSVLLISDEVTLERAAAPAKTVDPGVRESTFFEDIRGQSAYRDNFTINFIGLGPVALRQTVFDLYFKETGFGVDYFKTELLGGGLTGSMRIRSEKEGYTLRMTEVFAGINLGRLLNQDLGLSEEESGIDGDVSLEITLAQAEPGEEIDITKIDLSVNLSRIGAKALDRLLLFLDPNGSAPSVTNARMALIYAKPSRVNISARHGALSVTIDLKYSPLLGGQAVTMPVINRFPIQSLVNFESMRPYLSKLAAVSDAMRLVAATRIEIRRDGAISFR